MDPGPAVTELSNLTPVEQMLIAQVKPNMTLFDDDDDDDINFIDPLRDK